MLIGFIEVDINTAPVAELTVELHIKKGMATIDQICPHQQQVRQYKAQEAERQTRSHL